MIPFEDGSMSSRNEDINFAQGQLVALSFQVKLYIHVYSE